MKSRIHAHESLVSRGRNSDVAPPCRPGPQSQQIAPRVGGQTRHADPVQTAQPPHLAALEILAAHKGQASWWQPVVKTRDFEADWILMAPAQKTKTGFYADDRVFWAVEAGQMRVNIEGQLAFVAKTRIPGPGRAATRL